MKRIKDSEIHQSMNITGSAIRRKREAAGLTQKELSQQLETIAVYICRGSLSRIENGTRIVNDIELKGLSEILKVPISDFFHEES